VTLVRLSAQCALNELSRRAFRRGLASRRTKKRLTVEAVRRLLKSPMYWGPFRWNGMLYQGNHTPLVSKQVFDEVQRNLSLKSKPRQSKHSFAFNGLVTCKCGKRLTGQIVKRRYRYYGCSSRCGATPLVKESDLSAMFLKHLEAIRIDEKASALLLEAIQEFETKRQSERQATLARHQMQQREVQRKIDAAYDDKIAGRISEEYWLRRFNEWQEELATARAAIRDLENATFDSFKTADKLLALCRRAPELFVRQTYDEQARLVRFVESNSRWDGVTLTAAYNKPFDLLVEIYNGGPYGGPYTNFPRVFSRAVGRLPEGGGFDVVVVPAAA
jgi:hypothetical protein